MDDRYDWKPADQASTQMSRNEGWKAVISNASGIAV